MNKYLEGALTVFPVLEQTPGSGVYIWCLFPFAYSVPGK